MPKEIAIFVPPVPKVVKGTGAQRFLEYPRWIRRVGLQSIGRFTGRNGPRVKRRLIGAFIARLGKRRTPRQNARAERAMTFGG